MSSKIDERVVGMKFNNEQFQKGVADTNKALEKLKLGLNLKDAAKGLNTLDAAAKTFSLANLANGAQDLAQKFGALSIIGITALTNIANKAIDAGMTIAKSLTVDPIKAGLAEYELKMGSIQTILSNTARYGTSLTDVTGALDELNSYADKTIYNFGDMTKNIGLFTNAGIRVEDATSMIKGFSNEAASSGTNAQGAASAAYQLSQALSAGTIRLMDWRSLQNVGMGNKNMQNGLIEIAGAMGMLNSETTSAEDIQKNFNGSLEKNWLSADVMSNYLKIMAGDLTAAEQASLGLTDAQIAGFAKQQKMSEDAATKVRTYTQLLGTLQESVGSGWAQTFDILIGDFNQATDLWTAVNNELGGMIGKQADARNKLLKTFVDIGGRDAIIQGLASIWQAFQMYLMPIKSAFVEIFPPITAGKLGLWAKQFRDFAEGLKPTAETMKALRRIFLGVFAALDIGWMIIKNVIGLFGRLFGAATAGAGGFVEVAAKVGDFIVKVRDALKDGTALEKFFDGMGDALQWPIDQLRELGKWTISLFSVEGLIKAWEGVIKVFQWLGDAIAPVGKWLGEAFENIKTAVKGFFETLDFNVLVGLLNVGALAGIGIGIKKAFDFLKGGGIMALLFGDKKDSGPGMIDTIKSVFGAVTDTFKQMQTTLKAGTLMLIAVAIGLLVASVVALSFVDTGKMFIALGAMTVMFGQLSAMILAIDKLTKTVKTAKMIGVAIALGILAGAMILMSTAILILSTMDWVELARGLAGMAVGLGLLVGASALLGKMSGRLIFAAPAIFIISSAMLILAGALKIFSTMSWEDMMRAGVMLAASLGIIIGAMTLVHSKLFAAASMLVIAVAINILAGALKIFSTMSWDDIGRATVMFAAAMGIMAVGMGIMGALGGTGLLGAAAMVVAAAAITILAGALKVMATMSWDDIGRSMVVLAGGLAILAAAMALMGIPLVALGGLALFVVSAGLMMLAPALVLLGTMSWDAIGRGLAVLAASLGILALGGLLLIPASVGFLLFGAALLMIGGAVMMVGQGLILFAAGFAALVAAATMGAPAIVTALETIAGAIPLMMAAFAQGIIDFALVIAGGATEFTMAMSTLITALMTAIAENGPLVIDTIWNLIVLLVNKVVEGVPFFVDAGMKLIIGVLTGIGNNLPALIDAGVLIITNFLDGIGRNAKKISDAGFKMVLDVIEGVTRSVKENSKKISNAAADLGEALIDGIVQGMATFAGRIWTKITNLGNDIVKKMGSILQINSPSKRMIPMGIGIVEGLSVGMEKETPALMNTIDGVGNTAVSSMQKVLTDLKNSVAMDDNFTPTITPILDLSNLNKGSALIGGLLTPPSLKVDNGYAYASSIATAQRTADEDSFGDDDDKPFGDTYEFVQNNYSPKALSPAELYRQGSNLLSVVKKGQPTSA